MAKHPTKSEFLVLYQRELIKRFKWAEDADKLARFMGAVRDTLDSATGSWDYGGEASKVVWQALGGKGKPTLKALRALPNA